MILDGKSVAEKLYAELLERRSRISRPIRLGIVVSLPVQGDAAPVIESFVKIKSQVAARLSVDIVRFDLPHTATTEEAREVVAHLAAETDAVIVQLPLSKSLDTDAVLAAIPPQKDVDGISPSAVEGERPVRAPVARAVEYILKHAGVPIPGKKVIVIGNGRLVGAPTASLLRFDGADVSFITLERGSMSDLASADIIVCGAGTPGLVRPEHIQEGAVIIDAGTSEQGGVVRGDADPACAEKASLFTPVPGGVGPVAVAMIFYNLFDLVEKNKD